MAEATFTDTRFKLVLDATAPTKDSPPVGTTPALDTEGNRSYVRMVEKIVKVGSSFANSSDPSYYWAMAGTDDDPDLYAYPNGSFTYDFGSISELVLWSGGFWVPHQEDGTGSVLLEAQVGASGLLGSAAIAPYTLPLTRIDRAFLNLGVDDAWVPHLVHVGVNGSWVPARAHAGVDDAWHQHDHE